MHRRPWSRLSSNGRHMILAGEARALMRGRIYLTIEDIEGVAAPVLRHRIIPNFNAEAEGITVEPSGGDTITQAFPTPERPLNWIMGGWWNSVFGFGSLDGREANGNASTVAGQNLMTEGKEYASLVRVRKGSVEAFLNGKRIAAVELDEHTTAPNGGWGTRDPARIGFGTLCAVVIHEVKVTEVSGPGEIVK